ncbi:integrase [Peribacillus muralis]|uniref:Integrase n=1 Tax=Peribacillus muralis TaxID=264697 RepID=A0A1B3XML5_9BACI|nr:tyrosine-type recombinase/integrase [Peribacillus muralis]AOH54441.1 integrase [Peribacillus muralis]
MAHIRKYKNKADKKYFYEYRIRYRDPITQEKKEKSKRGFTSSKEALIAAVAEEQRLSEGIEQGPISLRSFLEMWLEEYKEGTIRKNTLDLHKYSINKHILPYFKNISLQDVKPIMYQKFLNQMAKENYSKRTIEIVNGTMYGALERAIKLGKILKNPCEGAIIRGEEKKDEIKFMNSDDIPIFLTEAYKYGYIYWIFFKVLIETGLRKGEAAALQWTDIDLKAKTMTITKTLDFTAKNKDELLGDPKTDHSRRTITISNTLANDLHFHKKYQNQNKLALADIYNHDLNLVLCRNDGNFMPKSSLFNAFSRILKRTDIPEIPIHCLRHTHAVLLLESGATMKYIQERLGHGSAQITADVYAHISKKIEKDTMDNFENYTKDILK